VSRLPYRGSHAHLPFRQPCGCGHELDSPFVAASSLATIRSPKAIPARGLPSATGSALFNYCRRYRIGALTLAHVRSFGVSACSLAIAGCDNTSLKVVQERFLHEPKPCVPRQHFSDILEHLSHFSNILSTSLTWAFLAFERKSRPFHIGFKSRFHLQLTCGYT
jgi:hypothetical protein